MFLKNNFLLRFEQNCSHLRLAAFLAGEPHEQWCVHCRCAVATGPSLTTPIRRHPAPHSRVPLQASQVAQWWRTCLPVQETQETQVWSLGQEDPLKERMVTHSSTLAWRTPRTEEPGGFGPWDHRESDTAEWLSTHTSSLWFPCNGCTCADPHKPPLRLRIQQEFLLESVFTVTAAHDGLWLTLLTHHQPALGIPATLLSLPFICPLIIIMAWSLLFLK